MGNDDCGVPYCHICALQLPVQFKLSGLCQDSVIDSEYLLKIDDSEEELEFIGLSQTDIKKNPDTNLWEIVDALNSSLVRAITAIESSSDRIYPFGAISWKSLNDSCAPVITKYKLSKCAQVRRLCNEHIEVLAHRQSIVVMMVAA